MYKKLYRSNSDKMIGGVAGGIAEYFEVDPTIIRILFVLALFFGGGGLIAYVILWIIVPEQPYVFPKAENSNTETESSETTDQEIHNSTEETSEQQNFDFNKFHKKNKNNSSYVAGIILIVIGGLFLLQNFFPRFHFGDFWPFILIAVGLGLLLNAKK